MVKFGIKAGSILASLALMTFLVAGCAEETPEPSSSPVPKAAPGAAPPGKGAPEVKAPAATPTPTPAAKEEVKK